MSARKALPLVAVMTTLISGCANTNWQIDKSQAVTPQSYSVYRSPTKRSIGRLRKILLVNVTVQTPQACSGIRPDSPPRWANMNYLHEEKGYDVIYRPKPGEAITEAERSAIRLLIEMAEKAGQPQAGWTPTAIDPLLLSDQKFDALMLVESSWTCPLVMWPELRWSAGVLSLGLSELFPQSESLETYRYYRATLFETSLGQPVWQSSMRNRYARNGPDFDEHELFSKLEQAVPALLTR